jgi:hypothetical protein
MIYMDKDQIICGRTDDQKGEQGKKIKDMAMNRARYTCHSYDGISWGIFLIF